MLRWMYLIYIYIYIYIYNSVFPSVCPRPRGVNELDMRWEEVGSHLKKLHLFGEVQRLYPYAQTCPNRTEPIRKSN